MDILNINYNLVLLLGKLLPIIIPAHNDNNDLTGICLGTNIPVL